MSLSPAQLEATRQELRSNFDKSGLTIEQIAEELDTTTHYIERLFALEPLRYEDTWILRNVLIRAVEERGEQPVAFSALKGDWHNIWFLNADYIDNGRIGK